MVDEDAVRRTSGGTSFLAAWTLTLALLAVTVMAVGLLVARAQMPEWSPPGWLRWFGQPGSSASIAVILALIAVAYAGYFYISRGRAQRTSLVLVGGLAAIASILGLGGFSGCATGTSPVFEPIWLTMQLFVGNLSDAQMYGPGCNPEPPVAIEVARVLALTATIVGATAIALAVTTLRSQWDRLVVRFSRHVICVIGIDDECLELVESIASRVGRRRALVVVTADANRECVDKARVAGARVVRARFDDLANLGFWHKLEDLYLLSPDPQVSLRRLDILTDCVAEGYWRKPVTVRIDDPWLAHTVRSQHLSEPKQRWAVDIIGSYDDTARLLVDAVTAVSANRLSPTLYLVGDSPLAVSLCLALVRWHREVTFERGGHLPPPTMHLVGGGTDAAMNDWRLLESQAGGAGHLIVRAEGQDFTDGQLIEVLAQRHQAGVVDAVILLNGPEHGLSAGRLGAHIPGLPLYQLNPQQREMRIGGSIGAVRTFQLGLATTESRWERVARLLHGRYLARFTPDPDLPVGKPWSELSMFYKQSNRRQVLNILWMVEAGETHRWAATSPENLEHTVGFRDLDPLEQLSKLGFDPERAEEMAGLEHQDWCDYYTDAGWSSCLADEVVPPGRKRHRRLVPWGELGPGDKERAYGSLADALLQLRELGYYAVPCPAPSSEAASSPVTVDA